MLRNFIGTIEGVGSVVGEVRVSDFEVCCG